MAPSGDSGEYVIEVGDTVAPGYCRDCGEPLPNRQSVRCADCRGATKTKQDTVPKAKKASATKPRTTSPVSERKAAGSFAKLAIIISAIWAWSAVKRYGIPDFDGELADSLAFTDEEAADIARPLGRFAMSNSTTAKIVGPVVENDDLIDAAFAIWEWQKRVNATLAQHAGHVTQDSQRNTTRKPLRQRKAATYVAPQSNEDSASTGGGDFDPLGFGYDANADARVV